MVIDTSQMATTVHKLGKEEAECWPVGCAEGHHLYGQKRVGYVAGTNNPDGNKGEFCDISQHL